jgi:hypothetical protein
MSKLLEDGGRVVEYQIPFKFGSEVKLSLTRGRFGAVVFRPFPVVDPLVEAKRRPCTWQRPEGHFLVEIIADLFDADTTQNIKLRERVDIIVVASRYHHNIIRRLGTRIQGYLL